MKRHLLAMAIGIFGAITLLCVIARVAVWMDHKVYPKGCDMQALRAEDWPGAAMRNVTLSNVVVDQGLNGGILIRGADQPLVPISKHQFFFDNGRLTLSPIDQTNTSLTNIELHTSLPAKLILETNGNYVYHFGHLTEGTLDFGPMPKNPTGLLLDVKTSVRAIGHFDYWWLLDQAQDSNWFGVRPIQIDGLNTHLTNAEILTTAPLVQVGVSTNGARIYRFKL